MAARPRPGRDRAIRSGWRPHRHDATDATGRHDSFRAVGASPPRARKGAKGAPRAEKGVAFPGICVARPRVRGAGRNGGLSVGSDGRRLQARCPADSLGRREGHVRRGTCPPGNKAESLRGSRSREACKVWRPGAASPSSPKPPIGLGAPTFASFPTLSLQRPLPRGFPLADRRAAGAITTRPPGAPPRAPARPGRSGGRGPSEGRVRTLDFPVGGGRSGGRAAPAARAPGAHAGAARRGGH